MHMGIGAVALIDALGFRGIWKRCAPEAVLRALSAGRSIAQKMTTGDVLATEMVRHVLQVAGAAPTLSAVPFSDTFLISATVPEANHDRGTLAGTAFLVACTVSCIVRGTALQQIPLTFRGAIATGTCLIDPDNKFFVGPAVDEAAGMMEAANGAFILLTQTAADLVENPDKSHYPRWRLDDDFWHDLLVDYSVPMKDGTRLPTKVVNPFVHISHQAEEFNQIRLNYRKAMESGAEDVEEKRRNTEMLFDHFEKLSREHWEKKRSVDGFPTNLRRKT